jgi:hypothetical protein
MKLILAQSALRIAEESPQVLRLSAKARTWNGKPDPTG